MSQSLNSLSKYLIKVFEQKDSTTATQEGIRVNPIVSELASWYERVRNAMDYRDEEVVLRAAIERILKRRHFYGGTGKTIAGPLLRELTWARYFPDGSISDETVQSTERIIDTHLSLRKHILSSHKFPEKDINKVIYQLLSSRLAYLLSPSKEREALANYFFHTARNSITIEDDNEETTDAQVFIATRRSLMKDDEALLFYHLFTQYFGEVTPENTSEISKQFAKGYSAIKRQLNYPLRHRIFGYVKRNTAPFFILEEVLRRNRDQLTAFINNEEDVKNAVFDICQEKYNTIRSKVNRAIVRSIIFVLMTKTIVALSVEGTFENIFYGEISWGTITLNIIVPPILLAIASVLIKTPDEQNSERIYNKIRLALFEEKPTLGAPKKFRNQSKTQKSFLYFVFSALWLLAFFVSFGTVIYILNKLNFNIISQGIFVFYLAIVSFLIYRIYQTAHAYSVERKQTLLTPLVDFFFMPIARVGRHLTAGVSQVNVFLFILDFLIEAPFKGLFAFFEQWFVFLHSKREYME